MMSKDDWDGEAIINSPRRRPKGAIAAYILFTVLALAVTSAVIATGVALTLTGVFSPVGLIMSAAGAAVWTPKLMLAANIGLWCAAGVTSGLFTLTTGFASVFTGKAIADHRSKQRYMLVDTKPYSVSPSSSAASLRSSDFTIVKYPEVESLDNILKPSDTKSLTN